VFKESVKAPGELSQFSDIKRWRVSQHRGYLYEASWDLQSLVVLYKDEMIR
jgi:hypothetical protein